jgi:hypothetical protein
MQPGLSIAPTSERRDTSSTAAVIATYQFAAGAKLNEQDEDGILKSPLLAPENWDARFDAAQAPVFVTVTGQRTRVYLAKF